MAQFKKYLDWHEKKKGKTSTGKVLGKRSTGGASSGKSTSKAGKRSKK